MIVSMNKPKLVVGSHENRVLESPEDSSDQEDYFPIIKSNTSRPTIPFNMKLSARDTGLQSPSSASAQSTGYYASQSVRNRLNINQTLYLLNRTLSKPELDYTMHMTSTVPLSAKEAKDGMVMVERYLKNNVKSDTNKQQVVQSPPPLKPNYLLELRRSQSVMGQKASNPATGRSSSSKKERIKSAMSQKSGQEETRPLSAKRVLFRPNSSSVVYDQVNNRQMNTRSAPLTKPGEEDDEPEIRNNTISRSRRPIVSRSMSIDKWVNIHMRRNNRKALTMMRGSVRSKRQKEVLTSFSKKIEEISRGDDEQEGENNHENSHSRSLRELKELTVLDHVQKRLKRKMHERIKLLRRAESQQEFGILVGRMKYFLDDIEDFKCNNNIIHDYFNNYMNTRLNKSSGDVREKKETASSRVDLAPKATKKGKRGKNKPAPPPPPEEDIPKYRVITLYNLDLV